MLPLKGKGRHRENLHLSVYSPNGPQERKARLHTAGLGKNSSLVLPHGWQGHEDKPSYLLHPRIQVSSGRLKPRHSEMPMSPLHLLKLFHLSTGPRTKPSWGLLVCLLHISEQLLIPGLQAPPSTQALKWPAWRGTPCAVMSQSPGACAACPRAWCAGTS